MDLPIEAAVGEVLCNKLFNFAKNLKYDGYQCELTSLIYNFFDKKSSDSCVKSELMPKQGLSEKLYKLIIRKSQNRKVYSSFKDNIWGAVVADMQLISKCNKRFQFLLFFIYTFMVNMQGLFLWKTKRILQSQMFFK